MESETRALGAELAADRAPRARAEMVDLASAGVYIRAPSDYAPTLAEKEQMRRSDEAEARAKARSGGAAKDIKSRD